MLHPRIGNDGHESFSVTDEEIGYELFNGELDDYYGLSFNGNGLDLYLNYYYAYEGREYLIGSFWKSNDMYAGILMIRGTGLAAVARFKDDTPKHSLKM